MNTPKSIDDEWLREYIRTGVWRRKFVVNTMRPPLPPDPITLFDLPFRYGPDDDIGFILR